MPRTDAAQFPNGMQVITWAMRVVPASSPSMKLQSCDQAGFQDCCRRFGLGNIPSEDHTMRASLLVGGATPYAVNGFPSILPIPS